MAANLPRRPGRRRIASADVSRPTDPQSQAPPPRELLHVHCPTCEKGGQVEELTSVVSGPGLLIRIISQADVRAGDRRMRCPRCRTFVWVRIVLPEAPITS